MSAQRETREYSYEADVTDHEGKTDQYISMCQVPIYPGYPDSDERLRAYWSAYASAHCGFAASNGEFPAKIEIMLYNRCRVGGLVEDIEAVTRGTLDLIRQDIEMGF